MIRRALAAASLRAAGLKYFLRPLGAVTNLRVDFPVDFPAVVVLLCPDAVPRCPAAVVPCTAAVLPGVVDFFAVVVLFEGVVAFLVAAVEGFFFCVVVSSELEDFAGFSSYRFPSTGVTIISAQNIAASARAGIRIK